MSCRVSVELLSLRLDGRLGPPDAVRLEEHLHSCATCAAEWAALREADTLLRLAARRPLALPADFQARVMQRVAVTPVARPQFWERERAQVQGGRPTVQLHGTGPISGRLVAPPAAPGPGGLAGVLHQFHPLRSARMGVYLGGLGLASAVSMGLLLLFAVLWTMGSPVLPSPLASAIGGSVDLAGLRVWVTTLWSLLSDLLVQVGPWLAAAGAVILAGLGLLWWRVVLALARRSGHREVIA